jgi:DNA-binding NtrC family response regulator
VTKNILLVTAETQSSWSRASQQVLAVLGKMQITSEQEAKIKASLDQPYDLVIIDDLPSAVELVSEFHQHRPTTPIIVVNSDLSWQRAREAWRAGATDVVPKPLGDAELSSSIKRLLG